MAAGIEYFSITMQLAFIVAVSVMVVVAEPSCGSKDACATNSLALLQGMQTVKRIDTQTIRKESESDDVIEVVCTCRRIPGDDADDGLSFGECVTEKSQSYYLLDQKGPVEQIPPGATVKLVLEPGKDAGPPQAPWVQQNKPAYHVIKFQILRVDEDLETFPEKSKWTVRTLPYVSVGWVNACPPGTLPLESSAECAAAAPHLGATYGGSGYYNQLPTGCSLQCRRRFFFNTKPNITTRARLICKTNELPCSDNAPENCKACTTNGGDVCELCDDGFTLQPDGTCVVVGAVLIKPRAQCASDNVNFLMSYPTKEACAVRVHQAGGQFFLWGMLEETQGECSMEQTSSEDCPEGWYENQFGYDFFKVTVGTPSPQITTTRMLMQPLCDETLSGNGADYRGCQRSARNRCTCQNWLSQAPHEHIVTPENYPEAGLGNHNYCRNPDAKDTIWCYCDASYYTWQYCDPL